MVSKPVKVEALLALVSEIADSKKEAEELGEEALEYTAESKETEI